MENSSLSDADVGGCLKLPMDANLSRGILEYQVQRWSLLQEAVLPRLLCGRNDIVLESEPGTGNVFNFRTFLIFLTKI